MATSSQRRHVRHEQDQAGCIGGLISIFDFRYGRSTRKLLSDRRCGIRQAVGAGYSRPKLDTLTNFDEKREGICDGEENKTATTDAGKTSVKELMEEEMFSEHDLKKWMSSAEVEPKESDSEHGGHVKKNPKQTKKTSKRLYDIHSCELNAAENLGPEHSCHQVSEQKTSNNLDLEVIAEELCGQIHQRSTGCVKHEWHEDLEMKSHQTCSTFEETIIEAIKVLLNNKFTNGKNLTEDGKFHDSGEFMDALHTLSSNKELLLKLQRDPNSLLVKHIQDLEDAHLEKNQISKSVVRSNLLDKELGNSRPAKLVNSKQHNFFRRKRKSQERNPLKGSDNCQSSNRIVILKPGLVGMRKSQNESDCSSSLQSHYNLGNKEQSERISSQFSFTEIKRKLKHVMGKERNGIHSDGITHRFESQNLGNNDGGVGRDNGGLGSPNRDHLYSKRFARLSNGRKKEDRIDTPKEAETSTRNETAGYPEQRVSNIYIEAKKHLLEMLSNGDEIEDSSSWQLPKTLGRILSLPEFNFSPLCSPRREEEQSFITAQMGSSPCNNFHMVNENRWRLVQENHASHLDSSSQNLESQSRITDDNPDDKDDKEQVSNSNDDGSNGLNHANAVEENLCSMTDGMSSEAGVEIGKAGNAAFLEESKTLEVLAACSSIIRDDGNGDMAEVSDEQKSSQCLEQDLFEVDQSLSSPLASPSSTSIAKKAADLESANERPEWPSPVSVLEPLFSEDDISPASTKSLAEPPMRPLQIHLEEQVSCAVHQEICSRTCMEDEESTFEYVEAVLLGSDLNWDEFLLRWLSSNQLLDPSLFDEVELFSNRSCHEQKLLFDCTNEVLTELCERYFGYFQLVSFVKQNILPVPRGKNLIQEVWEGVEWHLLLQPPPFTLDKILRKDMAKTGKWMDLRFDIESVGIEMGEAILEELMEDTVLSFVNECPENEFYVIPEELKGNDNNTNL